MSKRDRFDSKMSYNIDSILSDIDAVSNNNRPQTAFSELFTINFVKYDATRIAQLQQSLQVYDDRRLSDYLTASPTLQKVSWPAFENFLIKYLICIRDFDPWSVINSIDLFIDVFESESLLFNPKNNTHERICTNLLPLFSETMYTIISLGKLIDVESMHIQNRISHYPRLTHLSTILLKALNNIRSTPDLNSELNFEKIELLFRISTNLCTVYYTIGSPILCSNVFSNINILNLNRRFIKKSSLVKFRFLMGKYYAHQSSFLVSFNHLDACFRMLRLDSCPLSTVILILKYLIPVGLLVGKVVDVEKVRSQFIHGDSNDEKKLTTLLDLYQQLTMAFRVGNISGFYKNISANDSYWKRVGLWIPMIQRLRILLLRNLLLNVWKLSNQNLSFQSVKAGLMVGMQDIGTLPTVYQMTNTLDAGITDDLVENVLASLSFNGYLKIKLTSPTTFVLSKKDTFPDVYDVIKGRFPTNPREVWLDK